MSHDWTAGFLVHAQAFIGRESLFPGCGVDPVDLRQFLEHVAAFVRKARCDVDEFSACMCDAVGDDGIEISSGVLRKRIAHLDRCIEFVEAFGEHVSKILPGMLAPGKEECDLMQGLTSRYDSGSEDPPALLGGIEIDRRRCSLDIEDLHRGVIVVQHISLGGLADELFVGSAQAAGGFVNHLPLRRGRQRNP